MDFENFGNQNFISWNLQKNKKQRILKEHSTYRKFVRKIQTRVKRAKIEYELQNPRNFQLSIENSQNLTKPISSKIWKNLCIYNKLAAPPLSYRGTLFERIWKAKKTS